MRVIRELNSELIMKLVHKGPDILTTYMYLLARKNHKPMEIQVGGDFRKLPKGATFFHNSFLTKILGLSENEVNEIVQALTSGGYIKCDTYSDGSIVRFIKQDYEIEPKKLEEKAQRAEFDFDALYKSYPLKKGKTKGIEKLRRVVKTSDDYKRVESAIGQYIRQIRFERTAPQFIKHFSTFVNNFEDYVPDVKESNKVAMIFGEKS